MFIKIINFFIKENSGCRNCEHFKEYTFTWNNKKMGCLNSKNTKTNVYINEIEGERNIKVEPIKDTSILNANLKCIYFKKIKGGI